jgi:hypothetical protein
MRQYYKRPENWENICKNIYYDPDAKRLEKPAPDPGNHSGSQKSFRIPKIIPEPEFWL